MRKPTTDIWRITHLEQDKEVHRNYMLQRRYGITATEYDLLLESQNGKCAIPNCGNYPGVKRLHVDHNHKNGKVRGILCSSCNYRVGVYENSSAAILDYLEASEDLRPY